MFFIRKDPDAGKDWKQEEKEKGTTEDEMFGCHHWLNGHEFEQAPGDDEEQGRLACSSSRDHKELDATEKLNNNWFLLFRITKQNLYWNFMRETVKIK